MDYANEFATVVPGKKPHCYQKLAAEHLFQRRHLIIRAPTGAGKTLSVLVPFLVDRGAIGVRGMIYVLPLRTLAEAIYKEACDLGEPRGFTVAMQTGECADAEFFHSADIIVTTFDQLLSGLLCEPYGLSTRLWNINAAAMAGKLIVFDEFHLMGPAEAFVTALFGVGMFKDLCVSVWMTATATSPLTDRIRASLNAVEVELSPVERTALFEGRNISRSLRASWDCRLTAEEVLKYRDFRVLVVVNTVGRAQGLFEDLERAQCSALLLHSRFFPDDRRDKQRLLKGARLIVATQVIEAGIDISSEVLLTEIAPVNALVQRAGRCARFAGESGTVCVYGVPSRYPYAQSDLDATATIVSNTDSLNPATCADWVERAHKEADKAAISGYTDLVDARRDLIKGHVIGDSPPGASEYIRPGNDTIRVFILSNPASVEPQTRQALQLYRQKVGPFQNQAWTYEGDSWLAGGDVRMAYAVALPPSIAGYTKEKGLVLNTSGTIQSPTKLPRNRPGYRPLKAEPWAKHTQCVVDESIRRVVGEGLGDQFVDLAVWTARLHDLGKLQHTWQEWARERQSMRSKEVSTALAHTDFDWQKDRGEPKPPRHASASGLYGGCYLRGVTDVERVAVLLAVVAHHGGTLTGACHADRLHFSANEALERVGLGPLEPASSTTFFRDLGDDMVDRFDEVWPLAAILSRILRLSDQKATSEASVE
jgi:CRISPR-associated endonuclease/helicase Cas3